MKTLLKKLTVGELSQQSGGQIWGRLEKWLVQVVVRLGRFLRANWIGTVVILLMTLFFFWPIVMRIDSYSEGGDMMFNAWTLARNHHCIMQDGCPNYVDGNIYFPHKDTMLYSETQLSAGLLTLPLSWINDNPIFFYNVWTIVSVFLAGWFMYLLGKYISKGKELLPTLAGLVFAFAPFKMAAMTHLQNLSIFYLPLIILLILKFLDTKQRKYLAFLLIALILQFYASWYQMVFVLVAVGIFLLGTLLFKLVPWRQVLVLGAIVALAALSTLPLALEFMRFSKTNDATFNLKEQTLYSSSVVDYIKPHDGTLLGKAYYALREGSVKNAYNMDSFSYHGMVMYAVAGVALLLAYRHRKRPGSDNKKHFGLIVTWVAVAAAGFIISLGPLLKIAGSYTYGHIAEGIQAVIPAPWLLVETILPQLSFIRGLGRASVLVLFALCCLLAYFAYYMGRSRWLSAHKKVVTIAVCALIVFELLPFHQMPMCKADYCYNLKVPEVYKYVKNNKAVDNLVVIHGDSGYPGEPFPIARAEWVLWAGYHNKNIFNGYSGYNPPTYMDDYIQFKSLDQAGIDKMKTYGLRYIIIDKQLSTTMPELVVNAEKLTSQKLYEDQRYTLFKI